MKFNIYVPILKKKTIDFRQWYCLYIDGTESCYWYLKYEIEETLKDYKNYYPKSDIKFVKIPLYKSIII